MSRRSTRKRKPPKGFVGETNVRAIGRRLSKEKHNLSDVSKWKVTTHESHGNNLGERAVRIEAGRRLKPLIQETLRQQTVARNAVAFVNNLKKKLERQDTTLHAAVTRVNDLGRKVIIFRYITTLFVLLGDHIALTHSR